MFNVITYRLSTHTDKMPLNIRQILPTCLYFLSLSSPGIRHPRLALEYGGADRDRTGDPLLAKQVLSQLSYSPLKVVGLDRLELSTSPLSGVRSSHLSYRPVAACYT